jgi:hypothetical protein
MPKIRIRMGCLRTRPENLCTYAEVTGRSQMDIVPEGIQPHFSLIYSFRPLSYDHSVYMEAGSDNACLRQAL